MKPLTHEGWMTMGKFVAGMVTAFVLLIMVNCSGNLPKPTGMAVINHTTIPMTTQERQPCK